jgi:hypothetical protein
MSPKRSKKPKSAKRSAINDERQQVRAQLQEAGWIVGQKIQSGKGQRVTIELWPAPHTPQTAAAAGIKPRRVSGTNLRDAMRRALQPDKEPPRRQPHALLAAVKRRLTNSE